jgi:hypothetical protein
MLRLKLGLLSIAVIMVAGCGANKQASRPAIVPQNLTIGGNHVTAAYVNGCRIRPVGAVVQGRTVDLPTFEVWLSSDQGPNSKAVYFALQPFSGKANYVVGAPAGNASANLRLTIPAVENNDTSTKTTYVARSGMIAVNQDGQSGVINVDAEGTNVAGSWRCK